MIKNYWNIESGDSQASNWNTANWASGPSSSSFGATTGSDMVKGAIPNPWGSKTNPNQTPSPTGSFMEPMQQSPSEQPERSGYWSGGTPGAGSWMEAVSAPQAPGQGSTSMIGGARTQMPGWTSAIGENDTSFTAYTNPTNTGIGSKWSQLNSPTNPWIQP